MGEPPRPPATTLGDTVDDEPRDDEPYRWARSQSAFGKPDPITPEAAKWAWNEALITNEQNRRRKAAMAIQATDEASRLDQTDFSPGLFSPKGQINDHAQGDMFGDQGGPSGGAAGGQRQHERASMAPVPMSLIDPPPPWTPEAEQRAWLAAHEAQEHGPDSNMTSAVQQVRQQIADRYWEQWPPRRGNMPRRPTALIDPPGPLSPLAEQEQFLKDNADNPDAVASVRSVRLNIRYFRKYLLKAEPPTK